LASIIKPNKRNIKTLLEACMWVYAKPILGLTEADKAKIREVPGYSSASLIAYKV